MRLTSLLLPVIASALWMRFCCPLPPPKTPSLNLVELGMSRAQVEARLGPPLSRQECLRRYDMPVCKCCMSGDCERVDFGVYAGPVIVLYAPGGVFRVDGDRLRLPNRDCLKTGQRWTGRPLPRQRERLQFPSYYVDVDQRGRIGNLCLVRQWVCPDQGCAWKPGWWL